jgi:hypothetical protein
VSKSALELLGAFPARPRGRNSRDLYHSMALKGSPDVIGVVVTTFVTDNLTVLGLNRTFPLFNQPFPRNWIIYLALLLPIGAASC